MALEITLGILGSLGGGGLIVICMSNWLGKLWAERLINLEKHAFEKELESLRKEHQSFLDKSKITYSEKIDLYKQVSDPLIEYVVQLEAGLLSSESQYELNKKRLQLSILLGMFCSKETFEKYNTIVDYIFDCLDDQKKFDFGHVRMLALDFLNTVRNDIGIEEGDLVYEGHR